jgi:NAD(P)-dependent dehydrogenase (short-subunit alcohol dehydrogenase family)
MADESRLTTVVTGASAGIGRATAIELARKGAAVALLARGTEGLAAAARDVEAVGGRAMAVPTDVSDPDQLAAAVDTIERELGPIDIWVNAAFTSVFAPFDEIKPNEYRRVTEVTYLGFVYATMAILPRMKERGRGTIVQVGSALAYRGIPLQTAYCGAKHAIKGFTESLRTELEHDHSPVRMTMVHLPGVNTPQFSWLRSRLSQHAQPVPPIYQPEVPARTIAYAARHPQRREYWVGASTALTILGNRVAPGILDRYLARTGYGSQQTSDPHDPDQPGNLFEPRDQTVDYGSHGVFDDMAKPRSVQSWASRHRRILAGSGVAAAVAAVTIGARWARD